MLNQIFNQFTHSSVILATKFCHIRSGEKRVALCPYYAISSDVTKRRVRRQRLALAARKVDVTFVVDSDLLGLIYM